MQSSSLNRWLITSLLRDGASIGSHEGCLDARRRLKHEHMRGTEQGSRDLGVDFHGEEKTEGGVQLELIDLFFKLS